ncbi:hypothetical protein MRB53_037821 [Persea americana]|nr:hypothetical protein MRB53_037821 [Persea americana]
MLQLSSITKPQDILCPLAHIHTDNSCDTLGIQATLSHHDQSATIPSPSAHPALRRLALLTRTMSSTTQHGTKSPAPWKAAFLSHLNQHMDSPEFVLSTLHIAPPGSATPYVPRARYCIFRGMWGELPENKHNDAPKNPRVYESELPTFTTDVRMRKVGEIFHTGPGHAEKLEQAQGSGGGGAVEAVWWVKDVGVQWRVQGEAFVVGPDIEEGESSGVRTVKSEVGGRMKVVDEAKEGEWSWNKEVDGHFGNLSPG